MGNLISGYSSGWKSETATDVNRHKRKFSEDSSDESSPGYNKRKKKRKLGSTSQYIYNTLFVKGENSDVTICAFDNEWKLHKLYLCQAGYFSGMFNSKWKESSMQVIDLQIPDDNINKESLHIALGSLYSDELTLSGNNVVSVLAAASLIQLEGLMQQCSEVMKENITCQNVCHFHKTARMYGLSEVEEKCVKWLENNLMLQGKDIHFISQIKPELMSQIIRSARLFVLQVEMDVYTLLKRWLYLQLDSSDKTVDEKMIVATASSFFQEKFKSEGKAFLDTQEGVPYLTTFQALRLCNIIGEFGCCIELEKDGIVSSSWLLPLYRERWLTMLRVEQGADCGPQQGSGLDCTSLRCGRRLLQDTDHCWRWNGYNFGLDLLVTYNSQTKCMLLKRNIQSQRRRASVGLAPYRQIVYLIRVFSIDKKGHLLNKFSSGPTSISLEKDGESLAIALGENQKLHFPLLVSATFKVVSARDMNNPHYKIIPMVASPQSISHAGEERDAADEQA